MEGFGRWLGQSSEAYDVVSCIVYRSESSIHKLQRCQERNGKIRACWGRVSFRYRDSCAVWGASEGALDRRGVARARGASAYASEHLRCC